MTADELDPAVQAGVAIFNAGAHHEAHDAWEERWLTLDHGIDDERFLHGVIQYTAAVYHATRGNDAGAKGLGRRARGYLSDLPARYRGVALRPLHHRLAAITVDPSVVDRRGVAPIQYNGQPIGLSDLDWPAIAIAARVLADAMEQWDERTLQAAGERASTDDRFRSLVRDFVVQRDHRQLIYDRLVAHLDRERAIDNDVAELFDDRTNDE